MLGFLFGWLMAVHIAPMSSGWLRQHDTELSKHASGC
jgi:hypothetical protein